MLVVEDKEEEEGNASVKKFREGVSTRRAGGGGDGEKKGGGARSLIVTECKFLGGKDATTDRNTNKFVSTLCSIQRRTNRFCTIKMHSTQCSILHQAIKM